MKKILLTLFIITVSTQILVAQNLNRANSLFEKRAYLNAAELYLNEETKSQEIYEKLGDCYYFNAEMKQANLYYKILVNNYNATLKPTYLFRYSQTLKGINNFKEADKWFKKYQETNQFNSIENIETLAFFDELNSRIERPYIIHKIKSNSQGSDFGASYLNNTIVFASTRNKGTLYDWNNQPYLDLFQAEISDTGDLMNVVPFSKDINTKMHESNAVFTKDGKTTYFTRNNFINGKKGKDSKKISHLKIYKAELVDDKWTNITELPFNGKSYSVEHPALSPNEKQLYFASDMPGSIGSFDLFVVDINANNTYGTPKNLGPKINTEHREQFPFVSSSNTLYFSSDGHLGLGGLDVFKSEINKGVFSKPINLSNVINSNLDDFSFIINKKQETGYVSSNRAGGKGNDDIYYFTQLQLFHVTGLVKNKKSVELIPGAEITLLDKNNNLISKMSTDTDASYSFEIEKNKDYKIQATHKLYAPYEVKFSPNEYGDINKNIFLLMDSYEDLQENIVVENNQTQIKVDPIYFEFDMWNIREDAAIVLDGIVATLKNFPAMAIEIGAHTDCRGDDEYNLILSDKRANSVREYLIEQGISESRLSSVGYGETVPINNCIEENMCTREEYSFNRRCEFVLSN